jgi:hypothetical protein
MKISPVKFLQVCIILGISISLSAQNYPSQEQFGKNRVQYQKFDWKIIRTNNFEVYHYGTGNAMATITAQYAESELDRISELLSHTPYNRIKIFLYNSPQELTQSNMGMATLGDLNDKELDLAKSRLEIAFSGDQIGFKKQLIKEITLLLVYDMMYGGNVKEVLQNSLLLTLPDWFMSGIASYAADGWSSEMDDYMRDAMMRRPNKKLNSLTGKDATMFGHSIWNYIAERYGKESISSILNLTRIIHTEQTSISSTLQVSYSRFQREWRDFYTQMGASTNTTYKGISGQWQQTINNNQSQFQTNVRLSLDNRYVAITTHKADKYQVELLNTAKGTRQVVFRGKYAGNKRTYTSHSPLIAWQKNGGLAIVFEQDNEMMLRIFDIDEKGKAKFRLERTIRGINQVITFDISADGSTLALSAEAKSQNDLFLFHVSRGNITQLTNDLYDDLSPRFASSSSNQVLFVSNRLRDTLSATDKGTYKTIRDNWALYSHNGEPNTQVMQKITELGGSITDPQTIDGRLFYFFSDNKGINNLYRYDASSKVLQPLTNFNQNIMAGDFLIETGALATTNLNGGEEVLTYIGKIDSGVGELAITSRLKGRAGGVFGKVETISTATTDKNMIEKMANPRKMVLDSGEIDTENYEFDEDVIKSFTARPRRGVAVANPASTAVRLRKRENINIKGPFDYKGLFIINDAVSDVKFEPIPGRDFGYSQAITMNDLLENHIVKAGAFVAQNLRTNDLWAEYHNLKHRIDFSARIDRRSLYVTDRGFNQKYRFSRLGITASYPLSVNTRLAATPFFAQSRLLDVNSIATPDLTSSYLGLRSELIFDNTKINGMNMMEGTRLKTRFDMVAGLAGTKGFNRVVIDIRHYQKIHRDLILAMRFSMAHSGGAAPKKSVVGGMENWINSNKDARSIEDPLSVGLDNQTLLPIDNRDIFFVEFATNLRGFNINKISGRSHLLFNTELRVPLIKYLYKGPITSNFLRNLQFVGFTDIGTAWSGANPFKRQNSLNTEIIRQDFFSATVNNFRNPFLLGYGAGVRTMIFGFYGKFDYAWGLDNNELNKPIPYLTLGYDF